MRAASSPELGPRWNKRGEREPLVHSSFLFVLGSPWARHFPLFWLINIIINHIIPKFCFLPLKLPVHPTLVLFHDLFCFTCCCCVYSVNVLLNIKMQSVRSIQCYLYACFQADHLVLNSSSVCSSLGKTISPAFGIPWLLWSFLRGWGPVNFPLLF